MAVLKILILFLLVDWENLVQCQTEDYYYSIEENSEESHTYSTKVPADNELTHVRTKNLSGNVKLTTLQVLTTNTPLEQSNNEFENEEDIILKRTTDEAVTLSENKQSEVQTISENQQKVALLSEVRTKAPTDGMKPFDLMDVFNSTSGTLPDQAATEKLITVTPFDFEQILDSSNLRTVAEKFVVDNTNREFQSNSLENKSEEIVGAKIGETADSENFTEGRVTPEVDYDESGLTRSMTTDKSNFSDILPENDFLPEIRFTTGAPTATTDLFNLDVLSSVMTQEIIEETTEKRIDETEVSSTFQQTMKSTFDSTSTYHSEGVNSRPDDIFTTPSTPSEAHDVGTTSRMTQQTISENNLDETTNLIPNKPGLLNVFDETTIEVNELNSNQNREDVENLSAFIDVDEEFLNTVTTEASESSNEAVEDVSSILEKYRNSELDMDVLEKDLINFDEIYVDETANTTEEYIDFPTLVFEWTESNDNKDNSDSTTVNYEEKSARRNKELDLNNVLNNEEESNYEPRKQDSIDSFIKAEQKTETMTDFTTSVEGTTTTLRENRSERFSTPEEPTLEELEDKTTILTTTKNKFDNDELGVQNGTETIKYFTTYVEDTTTLRENNSERFSTTEEPNSADEQTKDKIGIATTTKDEFNNDELGAESETETIEVFTNIEDTTTPGEDKSERLATPEIPTFTDEESEDKATIPTTTKNGFNDNEYEVENETETINFFTTYVGDTTTVRERFPMPEGPTTTNEELEDKTTIRTTTKNELNHTELGVDNVSDTSTLAVTLSSTELEQEEMSSESAKIDETNSSQKYTDPQFSFVTEEAVIVEENWSKYEGYLLTTTTEDQVFIVDTNLDDKTTTIRIEYSKDSIFAEVSKDEIRETEEEVSMQGNNDMKKEYLFDKILADKEYDDTDIEDEEIKSTIAQSVTSFTEEVNVEEHTVNAFEDMDGDISSMDKEVATEDMFETNRQLTTTITSVDNNFKETDEDSHKADPFVTHRIPVENEDTSLLTHQSEEIEDNFGQIENTHPPVLETSTVRITPTETKKTTSTSKYANENTLKESVVNFITSGFANFFKNIINSTVAEIEQSLATRQDKIKNKVALLPTSRNGKKESTDISGLKESNDRVTVRDQELKQSYESSEDKTETATVYGGEIEQTFNEREEEKDEISKKIIQQLDVTGDPYSALAKLLQNGISDEYDTSSEETTTVVDKFITKESDNNVSTIADSLVNLVQPVDPEPQISTDVNGELIQLSIKITDNKTSFFVPADALFIFRSPNIFNITWRSSTGVNINNSLEVNVGNSVQFNIVKGTQLYEYKTVLKPDDEFVTFDNGIKIYFSNSEILRFHERSEKSKMLGALPSVPKQTDFLIAEITGACLGVFVVGVILVYWIIKKVKGKTRNFKPNDEV